jgi:hypothetical protein
MAKFLLSLTQAGINTFQNFQEASAIERSSEAAAQLHTENIKQIEQAQKRYTAIRQFEKKTEGLALFKAKGNAKAQFAGSGLKGGEEVLNDITIQASLNSFKTDLEFAETIIQLKNTARKERIRRTSARRVARVTAKAKRESSIIEALSFFN